ncbi:MAG: CDP-glycerol glycerophosphotransferase family protein [Lachnospiraceae bacterium]|nr:CDP-glycerol glycerophosphotransferase family protein [Lachnospiraceae bacterium]
MARLKKEELLKIVQGFDVFHDAVEGKQPAGQDELTQCQERVIEFGNYLELRYYEEDSRDLIPMLEEFCEALYELSQSGMQDDCQALMDRMHGLLEKIEEYVKNRLPEYTKEVVFLPYKASMWDSLESIYFAARKDTDCMAYVIPIPYFDKNADGSLGKMYYDGGCFPKDIPVTSWEAYLVKENRPDVIFIHNPYDGSNFVTTVHPEFYARELRKYTDKLIYVPYFVLQEIEPDDQRGIEEIRKFIELPAVLYADKVIVQSEKMKQIYVNEFIRWAGKNGLSGRYTDRRYQESRILGLGSPKYDKVFRLKKEDIQIPKTWEKIMTKPDGSRKKVVFYNTSINAFLANDEQMLKKIKDVFRIFYENREDVALLWRPHPLMESTIKSMRPALWEEYSQMLREYRSAGWGIYDDSEDMNRAILISDAYYGDGSSIVQLYQKIGKPILLQTPYVFPEE